MPPTSAAAPCGRVATRLGLWDAQDYLLRVYCYIELNPVRANRVAHPRSYQWSSYAINGGGKASDRLKPHALYLALASGPAERTATYLALFQTELDPEDTARIRTAVNLGIGVGDARFRKGEHAPAGEQVDLF